MIVTVQKVSGGILINVGNASGKVTYKQAETLAYALLKLSQKGQEGK